MPRKVGNPPQSVEARLERLGWRERESPGRLDTLPRPGETTFEDEDFANCFIAGGTAAPNSAVATTAETAAPVASTAGEDPDGGEVCVDGNEAETTVAGAGVVGDPSAGEGSAPPRHDTPAPRRAIAHEPLEWRRPGVPPPRRPRVSARKLLRRPERASRQRRRPLPAAVLLATVTGAVAVAGVAGAFSSGAAPRRSAADAARAHLTTPASSRALPPSDQSLHRAPSHSVTQAAARRAGHAALPHRTQPRRRPQRGHHRTARRTTPASTPAAASNTSSTGSSTGSSSGSSSPSDTGASSTSASTSDSAATQSASAVSVQHTSSTQPAFGQNGTLGPGRGAAGTQ